MCPKKPAAPVSHGILRAPPKRIVNLIWQPDVLQEDTIDLEGLTIRKQDGGSTWTVASLLPTTGIFSWHVRIDACYKDLGAIFIGVSKQGLKPWTSHVLTPRRLACHIPQF